MFNLKNLTGNKNFVQILAIVGVSILLLYLVKTYYYDDSSEVVYGDHEEGFYDYDSTSPVGDYSEPSESNQVVMDESANQVVDAVPQPGEVLGENEQPKAVGDANEVSNVGGHYLPNQCFPKDVLSSSDLLPQDADSKYAQINPAGQGSITGSNFLTAGFHVGINTVGTSLRNANYQLRSEPPNPQVKVSPWNQTTIDPDVLRRPLEIGGY
jgi:hypothetical protein